MGDDRLLEADDAWQMVCLASTNPFDEVLAQLLLDGQDLVAGLAKLSNRRRLLSCHFLSASLHCFLPAAPIRLRGRRAR